MVTDWGGSETVKESGFPPVTVVVPTWRPTTVLARTVQILRRQIYPATLEVFDLASVTNRSEAAAAAARAPYFDQQLVIDQNSFRHGPSRNLAVAKVRSPVVVFITQDAIPANRQWLRRMVEPLLTMDVAASTGYHFTPGRGRYRLLQVSINMDRSPSFRSLEDQIVDGYLDVGAIQFMSNNCAAYRTDVLKSLPFPAVDFAEDQAWARQALRQGYRLAYARGAWTEHWNDLGLKSAWQRGRQEAQGLTQLAVLESASRPDPFSLSGLGRSLIGNAIAEVALARRFQERSDWLSQIRNFRDDAAQKLGYQWEVTRVRLRSQKLTP